MVFMSRQVTWLTLQIDREEVLPAEIEPVTPFNFITGVEQTREAEGAQTEYKQDKKFELKMKWCNVNLPQSPTIQQAQTSGQWYQKFDQVRESDVCKLHIWHINAKAMAWQNKAITNQIGKHAITICIPRHFSLSFKLHFGIYLTDMEGIIYMQLSMSFERMHQTDTLQHFLKYIHGLKQASRVWNKHLH